MAPNSHTLQRMNAFTISALGVELLRSESALIYKHGKQLGDEVQSVALTEMPRILSVAFSLTPALHAAAEPGR